MIQNFNLSRIKFNWNVFFTYKKVIIIDPKDASVFKNNKNSRTLGLIKKDEEYLNANTSNVE